LKKNYKIKHTSNNNPKKVPASKTDNVFLLFIVGIYFILLVIGVIKHEMWRDEWQAWLIAINSHSLGDLYENCRYEGHPILWHLLLFIITSFSHNPFYMQLLHIVIATTSVFLFNRYSQLSILQRVLFTFGYYSIYEYSIISRSYGIDLALVILYCVLYINNIKNHIWLFLVLSLLANNSVYGLGTSFILLLFFLFDYYKNNRLQSISKSQLYSGLLMFIVFAFFSVIQIMPEADNERQKSIMNLLKPENLSIVISRIYNAYTLLPEMNIYPLWNAGEYIANPAKSHVVASILIFVLSLIVFLRKPMICALYIIGTFSMMVLIGIAEYYSPRYIGHLFIFFISALLFSNIVNDHQYSNRFLEKAARIGGKIKNIFIILIFLCQAVVGISYYYADIKKPFSISKNAADYILEQHLDSLPIIGTRDFITSNLSALMNKKIFYPERNEFGSFIIWDSKRNLNQTFDATIHSIDSVLGSKNKQSLLVLNYPLTYVKENTQFLFEQGMLSSTIHLSLINRSEGGMVRDETYYTYLAKRIN
jgi:hypothetical protein